MQLVLTEDQNEIAQTARALMRDRSPLSRVRALRDENDPKGYSPALWQQMAELGWFGIPFAEADGGLGLGLAEVALVTEAMGMALAPEPFLASVMLGGRTVALAGNAAQRGEHLPGVIDGSRLMSLAHAEPGSRHDRYSIQTRVARRGPKLLLSGEKTLVLDGTSADTLVVVARGLGERCDRDGLVLVLVPSNSPGVTVTAQRRVDGRGAAMLRFDSVELSGDAVLEEGGGADVLDRVLDGATVALCGEMLGAMTQAFEMTLDYLKERKQFDTVIGSFQALKHRAARVFIEIELSRSTVMAAARALDAGSPRGPELVSLAKARCTDAFNLTTNEAVQLHGGIGMTDEHDIGFFMKRAKVAEMTFGDAAYHRDRFARLNGF